ncbi:Ig-like domain-containing protein [Aeromonas caviae]|uniref:Ig-like domain-containing protein n=1 Tax=Aeromonas caviae TaxID=648 RepID=UPI0029D516A7|nr:Ig-like domain-containing protein [Aeromonas caviae]MDX7827583.1 Ig-like domain-containing protein [Aeromonas caviae]
MTTSDIGLMRIQIIPTQTVTKGKSVLTLAKGNTQPFVAMGYYSDGTAHNISTSVRWIISDPTVANIDFSGLLTGIETGTVHVTASKENIISNAVMINISAASITDIQLTPSILSLPKGQTHQLTAIATYSDHTTADISHQVAWLPVGAHTVSVNSAGILTGMMPGTTEVTASKDGIISNTANITITDATLTAIQVTPPSVSLAKGQTRQLTATATYSDNTTADISSDVTWLAVDITTATISSTGLLTGITPGSTAVTAIKDGITSDTINITVTPATLTAIQVTPPNVSLAKGQTQQLTATATYSDNTTGDISSSVTWLPVDAVTATVTPEGLLTGVEEGATEINASKDGINSNNVTVSVTAAILTSIDVTPKQASLLVGQPQQLTAIATYSDSSTSDVSDSVAWLSLDTDTATVTLSGLLNAGGVGTTDITASKDGMTSNAVAINVSAPAFTDISAGNIIYALGAGFPGTGFTGAEFVLNVSGTASSYHWSSNTPWVSVDSSGNVRFISQGNAAPVTIMAMPKWGGAPLAYTFQVTSWFEPQGAAPQDWVSASSGCATLGWSQPSITDLTSGTRGVGSLWSEWGDLGQYGNAGFTSNFYWTSEAEGSDGHYAVHLGAGDFGSGNDTIPLHGVCHTHI